MLTRVYGIAFADKEALNDHLTFLEEVKKRDHRKIGNDLKLWKFAEEIGGGLPLWLPAGSRLRGKLEKILYSAHRRRGYEPLRGPEMLRSDLWRVSGHIQNYGENMYFTTIDEHEYGIKPMNCVGHIKAYESDLRSYKELPIRYFEFGTVHRHEQSGALHGLLRVREFTQDDAHIFCTDDQIQSEIHDIMEFVQTLMGALGFEYTIYVSTKPDKAIGDDAFWLKATDAIMTALDEKSLPYQIDEGGGAFYGPKIDIKVLDALKREWQCGTIQVDLNLPERFELEYTAADNTKKRPVMLHRAILGSFERFIAIMTEHFSGEFPFYLAPVQVVIIPIGDSHFDYAKEVQKLLNTHEIDADVYAKNESLNKRVRQAEMQKVPMIVVIGDEEVASRTLALRDRRRRERSNIALDDFLNFVKDENGANL
jgi:threonyl-tRNA synthetase